MAKWKFFTATFWNVAVVGRIRQVDRPVAKRKYIMADANENESNKAHKI